MSVTNEQAAGNMNMFGVLDINLFKQMIMAQLTYKHSGGGMTLVSLLSDVQQMLEFGKIEEARQAINRVKYLIMEADDIQTIKFSE